MKKSNFGGIGIDTSTINQLPEENLNFETYDYIHTSISSNNDYLLSDFIDNRVAPLITTVNSLNDDTLDLLDGHLSTLGRLRIDLLLVDAKNGVSDSFNFEKLEELGIVEEIGIRNPTNVSQLQELMKKFKNPVKYIALDISPLQFNYDVIKWCNDNNIEIIGFNSFGGGISSAACIEAFTAPYLLEFSFNYCVILMLSGDNLYKSEENANYLRELIKKPEDTIDKKFIINKNINKLIKPLKKVINPSVIIGDNIISYTPTYLLSPNSLLLNFTTETKFSTDSPEVTEDEREIRDYLKKFTISNTTDRSSSFAKIRYLVLQTLRYKYRSDDWAFEYIKIGEEVMGIKLYHYEKKRWGKKRGIDSVKFFLVVLPKDKDEVLFLEA